LPFEDSFFDLVINQHESFSAKEVCRILKPNGIFVTQQVGGQNNRVLARFVLENESKIIDSNFNLEKTTVELAQAGFTILGNMEHFPQLKFFDVGAIVYFAKVIEWEFPGFSVEKCYDKLCLLQEKIEKDGYISSNEHRFFIVAQK
jgi:SAM-dependent methyltransferase